MPKKDDTNPAPKAPAPRIVPNPGQIFEEPVQPESETADESAQGPAQPNS